MKDRTDGPQYDLIANEKLPPDEEVLAWLDADLDRRRREELLEDAVDEATQPTAEEVRHYDDARRRIYQKLGIVDEVEELLSVEAAIDRRVSAALGQLAESRKNAGG